MGKRLRQRDHLQHALNSISKKKKKKNRFLLGSEKNWLLFLRKIITIHFNTKHEDPPK